MTSNAPLLWLFDPEDPLIDLGDDFAFGNILVPLEPLTTPAASTDPDYPWAWLTSPYWPAGATTHDNDNGLTLPGLFPHLTVAAPVVSDELDFPFAWVLKKSNIPGNVFHDPGNGIFIRPLFPSVVVTIGGGAVINLSSTVAGTSTATGSLTVTHQLSGTVVGGSSVSAALGDLVVAFEIPYLVGLGGKHTIELPPFPYVRGIGNVTGTLTLGKAFEVAPAGTSTVTGTLFVSAGTGFLLADSVEGGSTVTGWLHQFDGTNIELAGVIAGVATVTGGTERAFLPRHLYLYLNVGVGFDDTDLYVGADLVIQNFPDGHTEEDFARYLYQYLNVGVGFTYDDPSARADFVAYTEPDGSNRDDFARYLYQYLRVIRGRKGYGRLAILPGYVDGNEFVPKPKPPSGVF